MAPHDPTYSPDPNQGDETGDTTSSSRHEVTHAESDEQRPTLPQPVGGSEDMSTSTPLDFHQTLPSPVEHATSLAELQRQIAAMSLLLGPFPRPFAGYELLRRLGKGGMGWVFLARIPHTAREVAIKVPTVASLENPTNIQRFLAEGRVAAQLSHPGLCKIHGVDEWEGLCFITMEYIQGYPLHWKLCADHAAAVTLVIAIADAMAYAHENNVIHRDLKPSNILVQPDGKLRVLDFGLAIRLEDHATPLTQTNVRVGTRTYMAPEQFRYTSAHLTPACDQYALGVILYELLSSRLPFRHDDLHELEKMVIHELPPSLCSHNVNPELAAICEKALAKNASERFENMAAFAKALRQWLTNNDAADEISQGSKIHSSAISDVGENTNYHQKILSPATGVNLGQSPSRPPDFRFVFAGMGDVAPELAPKAHRLFLDTGNGLRVGVIDHHQRTGTSESSASLVLSHPELIAQAVDNQSTQPFTIVLHEQPDLDCVASAFLAVSYIKSGTFPVGAGVLARYIDQVDGGYLGVSIQQPYTLYAAFVALASRFSQQKFQNNAERYQAVVYAGVELLRYTLETSLNNNLPLPHVDAFACTALFGDADRENVKADLECYRAQWTSNRGLLRTLILHLPDLYGARVPVPTLLAREVYSTGDAQRCVYFRDWARSDVERCPEGPGFVALSVFHEQTAQQRRRCILSVKPGVGIHLHGLGELLDQAEAARRVALYGCDDRVQDPITGKALPPRPGYNNSDPWYDGRAHAYSIIDAPRQGTLLTAEEIEAIFVKYGGP